MQHKTEQDLNDAFLTFLEKVQNLYLFLDSIQTQYCENSMNRHSNVTAIHTITIISLVNNWDWLTFTTSSALPFRLNACFFMTDSTIQTTRSVPPFSPMHQPAITWKSNTQFNHLFNNSVLTSTITTIQFPQFNFIIHLQPAPTITLNNSIILHIPKQHHKQLRFHPSYITITYISIPSYLNLILNCKTILFTEVHLHLQVLTICNFSNTIPLNWNLIITNSV